MQFKTSAISKSSSVGKNLKFAASAISLITGLLSAPAAHATVNLSFNGYSTEYNEKFHRV